MRNQPDALIFQMAWKSTEEQALNLIGQHMRVMKDENKEELSGLYSWLIFPERRQEDWSMQHGNAWDLVKWTTLEGVTFVTTWDNDHLLNNLRYAMIQELMRKGPSQYCIIDSNDPSLESKILDRKSTRLNSSHSGESRMPSSA